MVELMLLRIKYPDFPVKYLDDIASIECVGGVINAVVSPWYTSYYIFQFDYKGKRYRIERDAKCIKLVILEKNILKFWDMESLLGVLCQLS